ncbi:MAG: Xaa-Pro peptidase family protein [Actinomycetota bacterium]
MHADHARRLATAAERLAAEDLDALVVAPSPDLAYLTGYEPMPLERATFLIVVAGSAPRLLVPMLERPLALDAPGAAAVEVIAWPDGEDPYAAIAAWLPTDARVALGDRIWGVHVLALQRAAPEATWTSARPVVGALRARKDAAELDALRRAGAAADAALADLLVTPLAGRSELDIAADLARFLVEHGHDRAEFTIVASGPNAASPHHEPTGRVVSGGDALVLDFGGVFEGYYSDMTRTLSVGEPSPELIEVHGVVAAAQAAARGAVRPGVEIQTVDRAARSVIVAAGYGERFFHRTGHGIGLEVHEPPYAAEGDTTILEPGMTFSVEPGIYLDGRLGVRIEDIVAVTADGLEELNRSPRNLVVVD